MVHMHCYNLLSLCMNFSVFPPSEILCFSCKIVNYSSYLKYIIYTDQFIDFGLILINILIFLGSSMFESMWNSMTSSMQLAEECLKQSAAEGKDVDQSQPLEGLELFAQTIDSSMVTNKHIYLVNK
jgi:hypothetical protein